MTQVQKNSMLISENFQLLQPLLKFVKTRIGGYSFTHDILSSVKQANQDTFVLFKVDLTVDCFLDFSLSVAS